jgi:Cysteine rich repeat
MLFFITAGYSACRGGLMVRYLVLTAMFMSAPAVAMAQSDRERGDKACRGDVQRLCKSVVEQGDMAILACLQTNRSRLSGTCTKFLQEVGQLN